MKSSQVMTLTIMNAENCVYNCEDLLYLTYLTQQFYKPISHVDLLIESPVSNNTTHIRHKLKD